MQQPSWFDLADYPPEQDSEYWALEVFRRVLMRDLPDTVLPDRLDYQGIFLTFRRDLQRERIGENYLERTGPLPAAAKNLNLSDLNALTELAKHKRTALNLARLRELERGDWRSTETKVLRELRSSSVEMGTDVLYLNIDVRYDDETIGANVSELVRERRKQKQMSDPDPISERDYANWFTYGVLPYFDLKLWSDMTEGHLTYSQAARMIWPNGPGDAERIRKTTLKYIEKVITVDTVVRLEAKAAKASR